MPNRKYTLDEAKAIGNSIGADWERVSLEEFRRGLEVELEHGLVNEKTNVSNDNPTVTGKIALAHLEEIPDYYTRLDIMESDATKGEVSATHYYGDMVRKIFMIAAAIQVVGLPFIGKYIAMPTYASILGILLLGVLAGLTSPKSQWATILNTGVAMISFVVFEWFAIRFYYEWHAFFFVVNQVLALMFLVAIYYSTKTWRGMMKK